MHRISEESIGKLKSLGAKKVMIQAPEGLKMSLIGFSKQLEREGFEVLVSVEPCFGACDIRDMEAKALGCDALLHIGHTDFGVKPAIPVVYEPFKIEYDPTRLLKNNMEELKKYKKICLITTSQFLSSIEKAKAILEKNKIKIYTGGHARAGTIAQVLGCDYSAALPFEKEVDCFLYLGSGKFHPLGLAVKTPKPVLALDVEYNKIIDYTKEGEKLRRIKAWHIEKARDMKSFAIYISSKPGQMYANLARHAKKKLEAKGKSVTIIVADMLTKEKIMGMEIDCIINCACPRIWEDFRLFGKVILNPEDVEKL
ncbi:MAG: diphthamide biosynthesis enzyme Dph2 [Candidatus Aenigmarchaeota archaeon]|nr:diphthamide biosynthesis enzyme Dph2 [Candidatus Aenigmarchaeota archaeon]